MDNNVEKKISFKKHALFHSFNFLFHNFFHRFLLESFAHFPKPTTTDT